MHISAIDTEPKCVLFWPPADVPTAADNLNQCQQDCLPLIGFPLMSLHF